MKKPFSFRVPKKNEIVPNADLFQSWTGYKPAVFNEHHKELVAKTILPDATKQQEKDYQLVSIIRLQIRKATALNATEEQIQKTLTHSLDLIEKLHSDLIGIRLTYEVIKICRDKSFQMILLDPEPADWEVDERIFEQILTDKLSPDKQLEYLLYLRTQALYLGVSTSRIDEEILLLNVPEKKEGREAME